MDKIKKNEYVVINKSNISARVIEIYSAPGEFDRLFLIKYVDDDLGYAFESQVTALDRVNCSPGLGTYRSFPLPTASKI